MHPWVPVSKGVYILSHGYIVNWEFDQSLHLMTTECTPSIHVVLVPHVQRTWESEIRIPQHFPTGAWRPESWVSLNQTRSFLLLQSSSVMSKSMAFSMLWMVSGSSWDKFLMTKDGEKMSNGNIKCKQGTSSETKQSAELLPQVFCTSTCLCGNAKHPGCAAWLLASSWLLPHLQSLLANMIASPFLGCHDPQPARQNGHIRCSEKNPDDCKHILWFYASRIHWELLKAPKPAARKWHQRCPSENPPQQNPPPLPSQVQCQPRPNFWGKPSKFGQKKQKFSAIVQKLRQQPNQRCGAWCNLSPETVNYQCLMDWAKPQLQLQPRNRSDFRRCIVSSALSTLLGASDASATTVAGCYSFKDLTQRKCPRFTEIKIISRSRCHTSTMQIYERGGQSNIITHRQHEMTASIEHHWFCGTKKPCLTVPHGCLTGLAWLGPPVLFPVIKRSTMAEAEPKGLHESITSKAFKVTFVGCIRLPDIANLLHISNKQVCLRFVAKSMPSVDAAFQAQSEHIEMRTVGRRDKIIKTLISKPIRTSCNALFVCGLTQKKSGRSWSPPWCWETNSMMPTTAVNGKQTADHSWHWVFPISFVLILDSHHCLRQSQRQSSGQEKKAHICL